VRNFVINILYSNSYDAIEGILRFPSVQTEDVGWYLCNATSGHDTNSTMLYLNVIGEYLNLFTLGHRV